MSPFALLAEKEKAHREIKQGQKKLLRRAKKLPVQVLTEEEKKAVNAAGFSLEDVNALNGIGKIWINQNRDVFQWEEVVNSFADIILDDTLTNRFFYKSGIVDSMESISHLRKADFMAVLENVIYTCIAPILAEYNANKRYTEIKGNQSGFIINEINKTGTRALKTLVSLYANAHNIHVRIARDKVRSCLLRLDKKGIVYAKKIAADGNDIYSLCKGVIEIDGKWFKKDL